MIRQTGDNYLDVSPILSGSTEPIVFDREFSCVTEENGITADSFRFTGKAEVAEGQKILCGTVSCDISAVCARCLKPIERPFETEVFVRFYAGEKELADDSDVPDEDGIVCEDEKIDLFRTAQERLLLDLPFRMLCREECKGLCPKCGKDLNSGDCSCDQREIDPRLRGLEDFFK